MNNTEIALIVAAVTAVPGALIGFLTAARRFSGSIRSSEATSLWDAIEKERANLTTRLDAAYARIDACEARMAELDKTNSTLVRANIDLNRALAEYEDRIADLAEAKQVLEARVLVLQRENAELLAKAREA